MKKHYTKVIKDNNGVKVLKEKAKKHKPTDRSKPKDKPKTKEEVLKKAFDDMCKGLNRFGPKEILNLMVNYSHRNDVISQLLTQFPTVVALGDFLHTLPVYRVDKRTFRRLKRRGCIV